MGFTSNQCGSLRVDVPVDIYRDNNAPTSLVFLRRIENSYSSNVHRMLRDDASVRLRSSSRNEFIVRLAVFLPASTRFPGSCNSRA